MLDGVVVDVVDVALEVALVTDVVLPEASLPDGPFAAACAGGALVGFGAARAEVAAGEAGLDAGPTQGEVAIGVGQSPDAVEVVRQQAEGHILEGGRFSGLFPGLVQTLAGEGLREDGAAIVGDEGEEVIATFAFGPAVIGHGAPRS